MPEQDHRQVADVLPRARVGRRSRGDRGYALGLTDVAAGLALVAFLGLMGLGATQSLLATTDRQAAEHKLVMVQSALHTVFQETTATGAKEFVANSTVTADLNAELAARLRETLPALQWTPLQEWGVTGAKSDQVWVWAFGVCVDPDWEAWHSVDNPRPDDWETIPQGFCPPQGGPAPRELAAAGFLGDGRLWCVLYVGGVWRNMESAAYLGSWWDVRLYTPEETAVDNNADVTVQGRGGDFAPADGWPQPVGCLAPSEANTSERGGYHAVSLDEIDGLERW